MGIDKNGNNSILGFSFEFESKNFNFSFFVFFQFEASLCVYETGGSQKT
jgi:hypothetical protein